MDPYNFNHGLAPAPAPAAVPQKQVEHPPRSHSAADWIRQDDSNGSRLKTQNVVKTKVAAASKVPAPQKSNHTAEPVKSSYSRAKGSTLPPRTTRIVLPESPLAPMHTVAPSALQASSPPPIQPAVESPATSPSTQYTSMSSDHNKSASSATPFTPSLSSKRVSENDKTQNQSLSARDGQWMKDNIARRRKAEGEATADAPPPLNGSFNTGITTQQRPKQSATNSSDAMQFRATRTMSLNSHPISDGLASPPNATRSSSSYSNRKSENTSPPPGALAPAASYPPPISRGINIPNRRSSRSDAHLSTEMNIKETERSPPAASPESKEIPPVPRLDAVRLNSLTKRMSSPAMQLSPDAVPIEPHTPKDDETRMMRQQLNSVQSNAEMPLVPATIPLANEAPSRYSQGTVNTDTTRYANCLSRNNPSVPQGYTASRSSISQWPMSTFTDPTASPPASSQSEPPKSPLKHQQDPSIVVKDFYRPSAPPYHPGMTPSSQNDPPAVARDPRPADFDYLNSIINWTRESIYNTDTPPPSSKSELHPQALSQQASQRNTDPVLSNGVSYTQPLASPNNDNDYHTASATLPSASSFSEAHDPSINNDTSSVREAGSPLGSFSQRPKPEPFTRINENTAHIQDFARTAPPPQITPMTPLHANSISGSSNVQPASDTATTESTQAPRRNTIHASSSSKTPSSSILNPTAPLPLPGPNNTDSPNYLPTPPTEPSSATPNTNTKLRMRSKSVSKFASGKSSSSNSLSKLLHRLGGGDMPSYPLNPNKNHEHSNKINSKTRSRSATTTSKRASAAHDLPSSSSGSGFSSSAMNNYNSTYINPYNHERLGSLGGNRWMESAEYWDDDSGEGDGGRACAAPVVGFGRGR